MSADYAEEGRQRRRSTRESGGYGGAAKELPREQRVDPQQKADDLTVRTISAVIYTVAIIACLVLGPIPTGILVAAMACMCAIEFFELMRTAGRMPYQVVGIAGSIAFPLAALLPHQYLAGVAFAFVLFVGIWYVFTPRANIFDVAVTVFGSVYTGLLFSSVVYIRSADPGFPGALLAFGVMGSVWLNDATAYLVGTRFGQHKMAPKISPKKSWEGFIAGMVGSIVAWVILAALNVCGVTWAIAIPCALVVGCSGVLGDLFESRIKRGVGVKDSGNLMPGHGGMLDRSDSLLFATMAALALLRAWGIV